MAEADRPAEGVTARGVRSASGKGRTLADAMPRLVLDARRIASGLIHGLHGRRRAGAGESFWQYRHFSSGEPAQNVDWRRSGRDDHLYVREREWEAAHTVWIWPDRTASMDFVSTRVGTTKLERALVVGFALAELLVQGGERVGIPGLMAPSASRNIIERMAQTILHDTASENGWPHAFVPAPLSQIVLLSDFWDPVVQTRVILEAMSATGAIGSLVQIADPAEEVFPYAGRVEFTDPERDTRVVAGRAEAWAADYAARVAAHREALGFETSRRGWRFMIHRTDRPASSILLALHQALGSSGMHEAATRPAGSAA